MDRYVYSAINSCCWHLHDLSTNYEVFGANNPFLHFAFETSFCIFLGSFFFCSALHSHHYIVCCIDLHSFWNSKDKLSIMQHEIIFLLSGYTNNAKLCHCLSWCKIFCSYSEGFIITFVLCVGYWWGTGLRQRAPHIGKEIQHSTSMCVL